MQLLSRILGLLCIVALTAAACAADSPPPVATSGPTPARAVEPRAEPAEGDRVPLEATDECREQTVEAVTYAHHDGVAPNLLSMDIYAPTRCTPAPTIVWVHGGGWARGDKDNESIPTKAEAAQRLGAAFISVNHRLSTSGSNVRWPDHGEDLAAAIAWISEHGSERGLDPTRIVLAGHSAGAHLVAIVATDPALLDDAGVDPTQIRCVITFDSTAFDLATGPLREQSLVRRAFGTNPRLVADASPAVQVARHGAPTPDFLVITRGGDNRADDAAAFAELLRDGGGSARVLHANPYTHEQVQSQWGVPDEPLVTPPTNAFIDGCLAPAPVEHPPVQNTRADQALINASRVEPS